MVSFMNHAQVKSDTLVKMDLPKSIRANTDDHSKIYGDISKFFIPIRDELVKKGIENGPNYFEITIKSLGEPLKPYRELDGMMHILKYKNRVIAVVSETRTETNFVQFDFFKNLEGLL